MRPFKIPTCGLQCFALFLSFACFVSAAVPGVTGAGGEDGNGPNPAQQQAAIPTDPTRAPQMISILAISVAAIVATRRRAHH
jgi:hypothetical protein